ncbi:MAG: LamG domain-containing protein [Lachnospiraceae bacterium]|nr:LamG domain-containing protein [Lachnospiraceae bacterium]
MSLLVKTYITETDSGTRVLSNAGDAYMSFNTQSGSGYGVLENGLQAIHNNGWAYGIVSNEPVVIRGEQSMFAWVRFTALNDEAYLSGVGGLHDYSRNMGMGITIRTADTYHGYVSVNTGTGSDRTYNTYYGNTLLEAGNIYHIGFVYRKDGTLELYVNGKIDAIHNIGYIAPTSNTVVIGSWSNSNGSLYPGYGLYGDVSDFRIYDHAVSPAEIKEMCSGLISHHTLDNPLLNRNHYLTNATDYPIPGISQPFMAEIVGKTITISFEAIQTSAFAEYAFIYLDLVGTGNNRTYRDFIWNAPDKGLSMYEWQRYFFHLKFISTTELEIDGVVYPFQLSGDQVYANLAACYVTFGFYNTASVSFRNVKLEISWNDHPFYTPYWEDIKSIPEPDCSLNEMKEVRHGPSASTPRAVADTGARHNLVYEMNKGQFFECPVSIAGHPSVCTITFWLKVTQFGDAGLVVLVNPDNYGYYIDADTGASSWPGENTVYRYYKDGVEYPTNSSIISPDWQWHFYCYVADLQNFPKIALNGYLHPAWYSNCFASDFRIYNRELSLAEINELYKKTASIDNHGNVFCHEFIEEGA